MKKLIGYIKDESKYFKDLIKGVKLYEVLNLLKSSFQINLKRI
jgi:hypothetical protein